MVGGAKCVLTSLWRRWGSSDTLLTRARDPYVIRLKVAAHDSKSRFKSNHKRQPRLNARALHKGVWLNVIREPVPMSVSCPKCGAENDGLDLNWFSSRPLVRVILRFLLSLFGGKNHKCRSCGHELSSMRSAAVEGRSELKSALWLYVGIAILGVALTIYLSRR